MNTQEEKQKQAFDVAAFKAAFDDFLEAHRAKWHLAGGDPFGLDDTRAANQPYFN